MAAYPKSPSANLHQGVVNGITQKWADNAKGRMAIMHYATMGRGAGPISLKAATEHLSYNCVTRLGKDRARIMGSFHDITTDAATGRTQEDDFHVTIKARPGDLRVHIYVQGMGNEWTDDIRRCQNERRKC
ncbi:uncharacterized protein ASPGLDRAFT_21717 [Aspergillus glaucus CBS 516.65]|uniref:Uncharacterized protein n=1 Tax=Aspergillus glaucus CBS 516.65 TaxID=1160497 RepID=A0A1L9W0F4_ASPGL|nr:hypothetical protein ASPGLDRAFT_21717 [Aspergillus glaucus CBS 516.65]OJJ89635.1 hypothetical protein ASPGLDRAFT_21717 [Aspergillus glaucus CBS 516.65]